MKDAAAGSIWGAKAANGVIIITSKKGKFSQKTKIELNTNITITDKPDLFYYKNISSSDLIDVEKYLFSQGYRLSDTLSPLHLPFSPVYELLIKQQNGQLSAAEATAQINALRNHDVRNDFLKHFYQKSVNQQYALNVRGGSENISWLLSAGFDKNLSNLDAQYNRANFRIDNSYRVTKNFEVTTAVYYTESRSSSGRPGYGDIRTVNTLLPAYSRFTDNNGNPIPLYNSYRQGYIDTLGGGKLLDWRYFPLEDYKHTHGKTKLNDINTSIGLNYRLFNWLSADVKYRYEKQLVESTTLYGEASYLTRDLINSFSQIDPASGQVKYIVPQGSIYDQNYSSIYAQNLRGQLNFNHQWKVHGITAIAGAEISESIRESNTYRTYGYNPDILTYVNVDYATSYPQYIFGSSFIHNPTAFGKTNTRFVSVYSNAAYNLMNKYTLSASMRRDASNLFGVNVKDKWKPLWSVGFSWDIAKEKFYNLTAIPDLKFRITYGKQGNIDPSKVGKTTFSYVGTNIYTSTPLSQIRNFENPELTWEQVDMLNAGMDFSLLNKKVYGSIEFYHKKITDLYGPSFIDVTTGLGVSTIIKNVGKMRGNGLDISLTTVNINRRFKWITDFIFNSYKDKVIKYYNDTDFKASQLVEMGIGLEGRPAFSLNVYKWAGLDPANGDPQGYEGGQLSKNWNSIIGDGSTKDDIKYIGSRLPTIFGSVGNTFTWKNVSLTARITYKFKYYFLRESINYYALASTLSGHSDYAFRWQKPGDELTTNIPSFIYPVNSARDAFYSRSETLVESGDHIRLQYINLSYELPKNKFIKLPFNNLSFYCVVNNLGIIWRKNKYGIDPDYISVPPPKSYSLGIRLSF